MTPEAERVILPLVVLPGRKSEDHREDVLRYFDAEDGQQLACSLLHDATARQDPDDVEMSFIVLGAFGVTPDCLADLIALAGADWHQRHEDVVSALGRINSPKAVPVLVELTGWILDYIAVDDGAALVRKAIHVLGR
jgi:HEAT repeat protein